jgi:hypothetical protein
LQIELLAANGACGNDRACWFHAWWLRSCFATESKV